MVEFGPFRIDQVRQLLYCGEKIVEVTPKVFAVLLALVERRGQVVSKQELMEIVWPETAVEENNLARSISTLRKTLGETAAEHRYVITVPGRGYSFVACESAKTTEAISTDNRQHSLVKKGWRIPGLTAALAAGAAVLVWVSGQAGSIETFGRTRIRPLLTSTQYLAAALSPDGKSVVYAKVESGQQSVRVRQIESGEEAELIAPSNHLFGGLTYSPDGQSVFLLDTPVPRAANILRELSLTGRPPKEITRELDSPPAVSPDASRIAYIRETRAGESLLIVRELSTNKETRLLAAKLPAFLDYPAWSPDGRSIAFSEVTHEGAFLCEIAVETGRVRRIGSIWKYIRRITWSPQGQQLLVSAMERGGSIYTIWRVSRATGAAGHTVQNVDSLHGIGLSADGKRAITVAEHSLRAIWMGRPGSGDTWRQLFPASENVTSAAWIADGKILLEHNSVDGRSLQLVTPDGKESSELLRAGPYSNMRLCPDRRRVVYYSAHPRQQGLWMTDLVEKRSSRLLALNADTVADCMPNGAVLFISKHPRWWPALWSLSQQDAEPQRVVSRAGMQYVLSPDAAHIAYFDQEGRAPSPQRKEAQLAIRSLGSSEPVRFLDVPPTVAREVPLRWLPKQDVITYVDKRNGIAEIWGQRISGGAPWQITNLSGGLITSFDWSPDGKQLVLSRGMQSFELLLLELDNGLRR